MDKSKDDFVSNIMKIFYGFTDGLRLLMILDRSIANANTGSKRFVKKMISKNSDDFKLCLEQCYDILKGNDKLRLYSSVNSRSLNKAIRSLKEKQLNIDYADEKNKLDFYVNMQNKVVSALMIPASRAQKLFLLDLDSNNLNGLMGALDLLKIKIVLTYETKNGWHVIVEPFNIKKLCFEDLEIKKDAMLLLWYGKF